MNAPYLSDGRCGSCHYWGQNFYRTSMPSMRGKTCCADAAMDLPASFIPVRQTMDADQGAGCICWTAAEEAQG